MMRHLFSILGIWLFGMGCAYAQFYEDWERPEKSNIWQNLHYKASLQASASKERTPLWLISNRYGASSLDKVNGYLRASLIRPLSVDSAYKWGVGYGADVIIPYHYTSKWVVQQAFVEGRWWHGVLTVGSKEFPLDLKNNVLSTGGLTLGINARPIPQVRLALRDYWRLPFGKGWLHIKGHVAYGWMTDEAWQHDFTHRRTKYADGVRYHSKAGYLKIGNDEIFAPMSLELGLQMASEFGGTAYLPTADGKMQPIKGGHGLKDYWRAFLPGGADAPEQGTVYQNVSGNQLGSWLVRFNYNAERWKLGVYGEKYFEDHSSMLQLDYDGYGSDEQWMNKQQRKYLLYDFKDALFGVDLHLKYRRWVRNIVFEYLYTKYQSGPIYHDHTSTIPDHIGGNDDFYNHYIYTGWQHWGQVLGNPLFLSPIYNKNGKIEVKNNRFKAVHLGMNGAPTNRFTYKVLLTWQDGLGTYSLPYRRREQAVSCLLEGNFQLKNNWALSGGVGADFGGIRGRNLGFQLSLSKSGILNRKK